MGEALKEQKDKKDANRPEWADRTDFFVVNGECGSGKTIVPLCRILTDSKRLSTTV